MTRQAKAMFDLSGKVALVAGGAGYLGAPLCGKLAEQGAAVMVADKDRARAKAAVEDVRARVSRARIKAVYLDVAEEASIESVVAETCEEFGGLHVMVNAACAAAGKLVEELKAGEFDAASRVNLTGAFLLARKAAGAMRNGGSIIMFSSMYGVVSPDPRIYDPPQKPNPIEYGVAKAGIIQMVRYLAVHWAPRNVRVNAVVPGPFPRTEVQQANPGFIPKLAAKVPLGRIGQPEEIAGPVVFLASDEASYVTGHALIVDGGWTAW